MDVCQKRLNVAHSRTISSIADGARQSVRRIAFATSDIMGFMVKDTVQGNLRRYKVLTRDGHIRTIFATKEQMMPYIRQGLAVLSLPEYKHPWGVLYGSRDPLYGHFTTDPDNEEEAFQCYRTLARSKRLLLAGMLRSDF